MGLEMVTGPEMVMGLEMVTGLADGYGSHGCHWSLGSSTKSGSLRSSHDRELVRVPGCSVRFGVATLQS